MTRKDALREIIHIVSNARIGKLRKADIIARLTLCQQDLPFSHWSEAAIFDACDTWVQEHGEHCICRRSCHRRCPAILLLRIGLG